MSTAGCIRTERKFGATHPVYDVAVDGEVIGWVSRTGSGRFWINSDQDRMYFATRKAAVDSLVQSIGGIK